MRCAKESLPSPTFVRCKLANTHIATSCRCNSGNGVEPHLEISLRPPLPQIQDDVRFTMVDIKGNYRVLMPCGWKGKVHTKDRQTIQVFKKGGWTLPKGKRTNGVKEVLISLNSIWCFSKKLTWNV